MEVKIQKKSRYVSQDYLLGEKAVILVSFLVTVPQAHSQDQTHKNHSNGTNLPVLNSWSQLRLRMRLR